jgi:tetratricopeptide (TPR) repeat protein
VDAAAFHALALLGSSHAGRDLPTYMRSAAILEEAADRQPDHPGVAHYLIHSYDDPIHAPLGLRAARIYARLAPAAGHAQHMTSHIFLALGMWEETVAANEAAMAAADRVRSAQDRPPQRCGHYPSWLHYALTQQGRFGAALEALEACREEAGIAAGPRSGDAEGAGTPEPKIVAAAIAMQLRQVLETGDWEGDVAGWPLPEDAPSGARLDHAYLRALAAVAGGRLAEARAAQADLLQAANEVEAVERDDPDPSDRRRAEILLMQVDGLLHEADGAPEEAIALLREAAAAEEELPFGFGPPVVDKPSHELLGEVLLRAGRAPDAEAAFRAGLLRARERALTVLGLARASAAAGDARAAADAYGRLAAIWRQADRLPDDVRAALAAAPARAAPSGG